MPGWSRQLPLDLPHRPSLTRDDLVVSAANEMAVAAVDSWPNWHHPVLIVVGPEGAGKSHIAAAWSEIAAAAAFTGSLPAERPFAVVVDGIERFAEEENRLFDLVNAARLGGGFVLATGREKPLDLPFRLADLRSRLNAATLVEIATPDDDLLRGVLVKLFADRQLVVEPRFIDYLTVRMERSLAAARRIVEAVDREAMASREKVTRALIGRILDRDDSARHEDVTDRG